MGQLQIFKHLSPQICLGYRTKQEIDSTYRWAKQEIKRSSTYREFYNIICALTDFEGSLHNDTSLPKKYQQNLSKETSGYFPYPIKWVDGKWIINYDKGDIPLGAEIKSINNEKIEDIIVNLYKYYTTDGINTTGKRIGISASFSKYYRLNYGLSNNFSLTYCLPNSTKVETVKLKTIGYKSYYQNFKNRYSKPFDNPYFIVNWKENEIYDYKVIDEKTGLLTINNFGMGNSKSEEHLRYLAFLDSVFTSIQKTNLENLIVDVRNNGGGTDPNDLVTYSYLTQRNFMENKEAWISFQKFPYLKYAYTKIPRFLRPIGARRYTKTFPKEFPDEINGKFYENEFSEDHKIRSPRENSFTGNVYLLISPRIASAGSLFAAMVTGNENSIVVGEETKGGYYGHNGHTPLGYILPNSKIEIFFSIVNLEQDVPKKENQIYNRGIIPDYNIPQSYNDYLLHKDTQMNFVLDLIDEN